MKVPELPYKIGYGNGITGPSAALIVYMDGKGEKTLVTADYPGNYSNNNELLSQVICVCSGSDHKEKAEYIVHACNLYPELIEVLESARETIASFPKSMGYDITDLRKIDELLKRAKP